MFLSPPSSSLSAPDPQIQEGRTVPLAFQKRGWRGHRVSFPIYKGLDPPYGEQTKSVLLTIKSSCFISVSRKKSHGEESLLSLPAQQCCPALLALSLGTKQSCALTVISSRWRSIAFLSYPSDPQALEENHPRYAPRLCTIPAWVEWSHSSSCSRQGVCAGH